MSDTGHVAEDGWRPPKWLLLLQELRAPFFTASVVPVLLGTSLAFHHTGFWDWLLFLWTLAGTVLIHAGANVANDYFDHLSGNDEVNVDFVRPFTGGSRMIQKKLLSPREVLTLSLVCFAGGSVIGVYLVAKVGLVLLALGIVGILGGFFYTAPPISLVSRGLGEPVIGLNFGVLPVLGAYYVQARQFRWEAVFLSLPVALLIVAILYINQFQDYEADKAVGKRNWVVRLGRRKSAKVFCVLMGAWMLPVVAAPLVGAGPAWCLIALVPVLPALGAAFAATRYYGDPGRLTPANALTIVTHATVGLLLSVSLITTGCGKCGEPSVEEPEPVAFDSIRGIHLPAPRNTREAAYLGVSDDADGLALTDVKASILVVQVFDMYCMLCQSQAPEVDRLYKLVQASDLKDRVRFMGIGKKNTQTEADIYRDRYKVPFPMFPDPKMENVKRLGETRTPSFTIIDLARNRVRHQQWKIDSAEDLLVKLQEAAK